MEFSIKDQVYSRQSNSERKMEKQGCLHFIYRPCFDSAFPFNNYLIVHSKVLKYILYDRIYESFWFFVSSLFNSRVLAGITTFALQDF